MTIRTLPKRTAAPGDEPRLVTIYRDHAGRSMNLPGVPNVWWTNNGWNTPFPLFSEPSQFGAAEDHPTGWMMADWEPPEWARTAHANQWTLLRNHVRKNAPDTVRKVIAYDGLGVKPFELMGTSRQERQRHNLHVGQLTLRAKSCKAFEAVGIDIYPPTGYGVEAYRTWATAKLNGVGRACAAAKIPRLFVLLTVRKPSNKIGDTWLDSTPLEHHAIDWQVNTAVSAAAQNVETMIPITWALWGFGASDAIAEQDRELMQYAAERLRGLRR